MSHSGDQVKSWTVQIEIDEHENKTRPRPGWNNGAKTLSG